MTKKQIAFIRSLRMKKNRDESGLFIAEGFKIVEELLKTDFKIHSIFATIKPDFSRKDVNIEIISCKDMEKISAQKTPQGILALAFERQVKPDFAQIRRTLTIALDNVRDPGNMGTIIRTADWFGIKDIICSENCAGAFSPKVVAASSGSVFRVNAHYLNIPRFLPLLGGKMPGVSVYAAVKNGQNIYKMTLPEKALVIFGNESRGVSPEILKSGVKKISIPPDGGAESLNVGIAAAIIISEFRRKRMGVRS
ncbi:MAG: RNA methyltransferase [Elusimicrobia bacterium CG08_land_8_20_14_0_20_44_26]|nr:MAG: RNA methyltransferase [Elusimicrobia bacterium CG08_land_8_20_14_0_20_44_26]